MFLLHSARKLELNSSVNAQSYKLMKISQDYQKAVKETAEFQQYMSSAKQMTSVAFSAFGQQAIGQALTSAFGNTNTVAQIMNGNMQGLSAADQSKAQVAVQMGQQAAQQAVASMQAVTGSIFDSINNAKLATLQVKEQTLSNQKEAAQTELELLKETLQAEKSAEQSSIKSASVGYGLG